MVELPIQILQKIDAVLADIKFYEKKPSYYFSEQQSKRLKKEPSFFDSVDDLRKEIENYIRQQ